MTIADPSMRRSRSRLAAAVAMAVTVALAAGCGSGNATPAPSSAGTAGAPTASHPTVVGNITVFAASSLTDAFTEAAKAFHARDPGVAVQFNFASSSALATQINEGAPADVFASADQAQMQVVADRSGVADPAVFATNVPVVVTPKGSAAVRSFADLAKPGIKLVLAAKDVPIGKYARDVLQRASGAGGIAPDFATKVLANLKSDEANVRAVLAKVQLGEADAGIVYVTDIGAAKDDVNRIEIPAAYNVVAEYPIAVLKPSKAPTAARAFVTFLRSAEGQAILQKYGFQPG